MDDKILSIGFAYQATKNMKYLGPKGAISIRHKGSEKPLLNHFMDSVSKSLQPFDIRHHIVAGFESDKLIKCVDDSIEGYSNIMDHKNTNHGAILKSILVKYNPKKYIGTFVSTDISCLPSTSLNIDITKNYVFFTKNTKTLTNLTCNIQDDKLEYILYETSDNFWTGMAFLSNKAIALLKTINNTYFTDPLFFMELLNKAVSCGLEIEAYELKDKDFAYIQNNSLKEARVV